MIREIQIGKDDRECVNSIGARQYGIAIQFQCWRGRLVHS